MLSLLNRTVLCLSIARRAVFSKGGALGLALVTLLAAVSTPVITALHPQAGAINQALISGFRPALLLAAAFALLGMLLALGGFKGQSFGLLAK